MRRIASGVYLFCAVFALYPARFLSVDLHCRTSTAKLAASGRPKARNSGNSNTGTS